jgi:hypothetical protein
MQEIRILLFLVFDCKRYHSLYQREADCGLMRGCIGTVSMLHKFPPKDFVLEVVL